MKSILDPLHWTITVLDLPKRCVDSGGRSLGDGFIIFDAETATSYPKPYLLMDHSTEPVPLELEKGHEVISSSGQWLIGHAPGRSQSGKACAWKVSDDGSIKRHPLWRDAWEASSPGAVAGNVFVGDAWLPGNRGSEHRGIVWPNGPKGDVFYLQRSLDVTKMTATDGESFAGVRWEKGEAISSNRAVFWPNLHAECVALHPPHCCGSSVTFVAKGIQVGYVEKEAASGSSTQPSRRRRRPRPRYLPPTKQAALWRGDAESFTELSPPGSVESEVIGGNTDVQVGTAKYSNGDGSEPQSRAVLWNGTADVGLELHNLLGDDATESEVRAMQFRGDGIRVLGDRWAGSRSESRTQRAVLWEFAL